MIPADTVSKLRLALSVVEEEYAVVAAELVKAEAALATATAAYDDALGIGREAAIAARRAMSDAEVGCDVAKRMVAALAGKPEAARQAYDEAVAEQTMHELTTVALARIAEFETVATHDIPVLTTLARNLARLWAEAGLAREAAIKAGAGNESLPMVEGFRFAGHWPRQVTEEKRVTRWIHPWTGDALSDEQAAQAGDHGYLPGASELMRCTEQAEFIRTVYLPEERGPRFVSLMHTLAVPGLRLDDVNGWRPLERSCPRSVLAELDRLDQAPPPDRSDKRAPVVELRRAPPAAVAATDTEHAADQA